MKKHFIPIVKLCLISVYLIILAGATVRMTGSGMGCPDWPKCFGHFIPPTTIDQLLWQPETSFDKGVIIINEEQLFVAKEKFTSATVFNKENWAAYTKHDYAQFNATHTWVEYINRLISVLAGVFFLVLIVSSLYFWKQNKGITLLSFLTLFLMLFEAWLGKTVVDSNLATSKISIHMLVALLIVALLLVILHKAKGDRADFKFDKVFYSVSLLALGLTIIQIIMGIEVRQFVDEQLKQLGFANKQLLILTKDSIFIIHRSFSIVVFAVAFWLFHRNKKMNLGHLWPLWILIAVLLEAFTGILMTYVNFPFGTQAVHLLFAAILFGMQFYLVLTSRAIRM